MIDGPAIVLRYSLKADARVRVQVLAEHGHRILRKVDFAGKQGHNERRFRAVLRVGPRTTCS
jgi:hypothetical protein